MNRLRMTLFNVAAPLAIAATISIAAPRLAPAMADDLKPMLSAFGIISCSGSGPCQEGKNSGTGPGLEGISAKGKGVVGTSTSSNGVFGSSTSSSGVTGTSTNGAGVSGSSAGSFGVGVSGFSATGFGVSAITKTGSALSASALTSGAGVLVSTSTGTGVSVNSTSGTGVNTSSTNGVGLVTFSSAAQGIVARSVNNDGLISGTTHNSTSSGFGRSGVYGHDDSSDGGRLDVGVAGFSNNGIGELGTSNNWIGMNAVGGNVGLNAPSFSINGHGDGADLIDACPSGPVPCLFGLPAAFVVSSVGQILSQAPDGTGASVGPNGLDEYNNSTVVALLQTDTAAQLLVGSTSSAGNVFVFDNAGNLNLFGQLFTSGVCKTGCLKTGPGLAHRVVSYAPKQSEPSMDDFGEAQLTNGSAYVRLDPAFANVIDDHATYLVFITPEGNSRGLYVSAKSPAGFEVRENEGGRATLAFSYRIVAKPFGSTAARLPMISARPVARPNFMHRHIRQR